MSVPTIDVDCDSMTSSTMASLLSSLPGDFWEIPSAEWGDEVPASEYTGPMEVGCSRNTSPEVDACEGWVVPDLRLRKNIWENFPVSLLPMNSTDGTDRYAVVWHHTNLKEWRNTRTTSFAEWQDYEDFCYIRLIQALQMNSSRYTMEGAVDPNHICVIAMVHAPRDDAKSVESRTSTPAHSVTSESSSKGTPTLRTFRDISQNFPVNWDQNGRSLRIKFSMPKLKATGESAAVVRDRLLMALSQSPAFTCTPAPQNQQKDFICTVTF